MEKMIITFNHDAERIFQAVSVTINGTQHTFSDFVEEGDSCLERTKVWIKSKEEEEATILSEHLMEILDIAKKAEDTPSSELITFAFEAGAAAVRMSDDLSAAIAASMTRPQTKSIWIHDISKSFADDASIKEDQSEFALIVAFFTGICAGCPHPSELLDTLISQMGYTKEEFRDELLSQIKRGRKILKEKRKELRLQKRRTDKQKEQ